MPVHMRAPSHASKTPLSIRPCLSLRSTSTISSKLDLPNVDEALLFERVKALTWKPLSNSFCTDSCPTPPAQHIFTIMNFVHNHL